MKTLKEILFELKEIKKELRSISKATKSDFSVDAKTFSKLVFEAVNGGKTWG